MKISIELLNRIESDLGINTLFEKGKEIPVKNVYHFYSDGDAVDLMFYGESDFIDGMNRIFFTLGKYCNVIILAFALMDTHIHFVLHGSFEECNRFIHEYINRTSQYIAFKHKDSRKLGNVVISHQTIGTSLYLKTVICYTLKNPVVAGLHYLYQNYPWSSGSLYFNHNNSWTSPLWKHETDDGCHLLSEFSRREFQETFKTRVPIPEGTRILNGIIFPGDYVAYEVVERVFRSCKGFSYFLGKSKEDDVESQGGTISHLSIPIQEMRQHRDELCVEMFGENRLKLLTGYQRVKLARALKSKFNSSTKQISRLCGLVYDEVKDLL